MNTNSPMAPGTAFASRAVVSNDGDVPGATASAVSWGAIVAGAAGAAALSMILLILGTGLGLSSISPWAGSGASATTIGVSTIIWITLTQVAASGMGGYLAGRLRTKWAAVHTDEVYFRDTAHGFLAWAVATLVTAAVLTSAIGSILGTGAKAGAAVAGGAASTAVGGLAAFGASGAAGATSGSEGNTASELGQLSLNYGIDSLFRTAAPSAQPGQVASAPSAASPTSGSSSSSAGSATTSANGSGEVARIFINDLRAGALTPEDSRYVGQLVAQRTGLSQAEAEKRVTEVFGKVQATLKEAEVAARDAADKARKASSYTALWLFVSLLIGAFVASLAAVYGGRQRDL